MTLPLAIAKKLQLLAQGEQLPASRLKHAIVNEMIADGIIQTRIAGRTKTTLLLPDLTAFNNYLYNGWGITNLENYILTLEDEAATRADLVQVGSDSKAIARRTFKGFLVNSYMPIEAMLNGERITISPTPGTFVFIYDFERFIPDADVVIVGVENAENFAFADRQRYLFPGGKTLFVSRYPQGQSRDLIRWLQSIPNPYLHMGDYDFAGINIYMQEYKKHLNDRASFFIPTNIEDLMLRFGNSALYDQQVLTAAAAADDSLQDLIALIHKYKKGVEQEALLF
jgi:hypothetical protein